ncbi:MAG: hypothetical protein HKM95_01805 [Inquilinus sp.]|nr:hypothetical protein [Inquilinus sp.]
MSLRAVKGLVIGMAVILAVGFAALIGGMVQQLSSGKDDRPPYSATLDLPVGARIATIAPAGRRLAVLVTLVDGSAEIRFLDPETGRVTGVVAAE